MILIMSCKVGIQPWSIRALGFMLPAIMTTVLSECTSTFLYTTKWFVSHLFSIFPIIKYLSPFYSDLGNAALSGTLVPQLGQLKNLQYL
jgi:hypothetical protein